MHANKFKRNSKLLGTVVIAVALAPGAAVGLESGATDWAPDMKVIAQLERDIRLPDGAAGLKSYTLYYAGTIESGRRLVVGTYHGSNGHGSNGRVVIVESAKDMPIVYDGGCNILNLRYDVVKHQCLDMFCNGVA